jgi:large subunit ribosomal protein L22
MEVKAKARFIRMSPRKVRLVAGLVRGLDLSAAEAQLTFIKKAAAHPVLKLIRSAKANATHNFKLDTDSLFIKSITVDGGPIMHRWTPRAFGRAAPIKKRTSHITVILAERIDEGAAKELSKAVVREGGKIAATTAGEKAEETSKKVTRAKRQKATAQSSAVKTGEGKRNKGKSAPAGKKPAAKESEDLKLVGTDSKSSSAK